MGNWQFSAELQLCAVVCFAMRKWLNFNSSCVQHTGFERYPKLIYKSYTQNELHFTGITLLYITPKRKVVLLQNDFQLLNYLLSDLCVIMFKKHWFCVPDYFFIWILTYTSFISYVIILWFSFMLSFVMSSARLMEFFTFNWWPGLSMRLVCVLNIWIFYVMVHWCYWSLV
jgi:hypothetical protein